MCSPQRSVWGRSVGGFGLGLALCSQTAGACHSRLGRGHGPFATVPPVTPAPQRKGNPRVAEGREKLGLCAQGPHWMLTCELPVLSLFIALGGTKCSDWWLWPGRGRGLAHAAFHGALVWLCEPRGIRPASSGFP